MKFDFDEWMNLAEQDPDEFERRRDQAIKEEIAAAPEDMRQDLQKLQSQLDIIHERYSPQEALLRMTEMMVTNVGMLNRHFGMVQDKLAVVEQGLSSLTK